MTLGAVEKKVLAFMSSANGAIPTRMTNACWCGKRQEGIYFPCDAPKQGADGQWYKVDEHFNKQRLDQCYFCGGKITDYASEYEANMGDDGVFIYAAKNGVCEACAKEKSAGAICVMYPYIVRRYTRREKNKDVMVHEYSDGAIVEGVMQDDIAVKEL